MSQSAGALTGMNPEVPTQDERTMAVLAHVLQLVGWWIAPLIILLLKRDSRFVSFHALQALLLQMTYMVVGMAFMAVWFSSIFIFAATASRNAPPTPIFFLFPLIWLGWMGLWVGMLVIAIIYCIKASRGEWAEYPLLGPLARRFLKIGPGGGVLTSTP